MQGLPCFVNSLAGPKMTPSHDRDLPECLTNLYRLAIKWEHEALEDRRDRYPYITLLDDLTFHAKLRFYHYSAFTADGPFFHRLERWLKNLEKESQQQVLLRLLNHLIFIDGYQATSLYKDAFRRIILPWLLKGRMEIPDYFAPNFHEKVVALLCRCDLFGLT